MKRFIFAAISLTNVAMAEFDAPIEARWDGPRMGLSFPDQSIIQDKKDGKWNGYATPRNNKRIPIAESANSVNWKFLNKDALPGLPSWIATTAGASRHRTSLATIGAGGCRCIGVATVATWECPFKGIGRLLICDQAGGGAIDANAFNYGNQRWVMWKVDGNALPARGEEEQRLQTGPIKIEKVMWDGITLQGSPKTTLSHNGASGDGLVERSAMYKVYPDQYIGIRNNITHCYSSDRYDIQYAFSRTPDGSYTRVGISAQSGGNPPIYDPGRMDIVKGEYGPSIGGPPRATEGLQEQYLHGASSASLKSHSTQNNNVADADIPLTMSTVTGTALQSAHPPPIPLPFNANQPETIRLYPLSNYTFGVKETQPEEDPSVIARLKRLEEHYGAHGMRRTCEGILVCHEHNHPHILMLQIANAFFKLPGDYLRPEDEEIEGFKARLDERLAPVGRLGEGEEAGDWQVGDCLAQWWRPNFETFMYPFIPGHVTRPKECKKLYFIQLPKSKVLSVPKNMKLLAVPLFELYDNTARYGPQLSAIPHLLSRYNFEFVNENGEVVAATPGSGPEGYKPKTKVLAGGDEDMNDVKDDNGTS
ncbi:hypothetical protein DL765_005959 [Monosporascus sp. GIB2]|nr:hypothetical protein DL765_005959 [Monosporascus sp. GIB2]